MKEEIDSISHPDIYFRIKTQSALFSRKNPNSQPDIIFFFSFLLVFLEMFTCQHSTDFKGILFTVHSLLAAQINVKMNSHNTVGNHFNFTFNTAVSPFHACRDLKQSIQH